MVKLLLACSMINACLSLDAYRLQFRTMGGTVYSIEDMSANNAWRVLRYLNDHYYRFNAQFSQVDTDIQAYGSLGFIVNSKNQFANDIGFINMYGKGNFVNRLFTISDFDLTWNYANPAPGAIAFECASLENNIQAAREQRTRLAIRVGVRNFVDGLLLA